MYKTIKENLWRLFLGILLFSFYGFLFYLMLSPESCPDFLSFYSSGQILRQGENPYQILSTIELPTTKTIPANLNPPTALVLLLPFSYLNYHNSIILWSLLSLILGLIGVKIAFHYAFSPAYLKKNGFNLYFIYLLSFPTLMNTGLAQLGSVLLFLIMTGYHSYMKKHDFSAGILWGTVIAIKFFPALLFIFALLQKRYKTCAIMLGVFLLLSLIPIFMYGTTIYTQYFSMMSQVVWYGKSWNASLFGIIYRMFTDTTHHTQNWLLIHLCYGILCCLSLIFYLANIKKKESLQITHQSFCLTLVMMLFLSPLGWMYYFPLLALPIARTWIEPENVTKPAWFLCLFCMNVPINNIPVANMHSLIDKLGLYSFNFYGLILLLYLVGVRKTRP